MIDRTTMRAFHSRRPAALIRRMAQFGACALAFSGLAMPQAWAAPEDFVSVQRGTMPIILTAPHGGDQRPDGVSERRDGPKVVKGRDRKTYDLTKKIASELEDLLGERPFYIRAKFDRKYIDANRDVDKAYDDDDAEPYYSAYHDRVREFVDEILVDYRGEGVLIDIHGQGKSGYKSSVCRGTHNGNDVERLLDVYGDDAISGPNSIFGTLSVLGYSVFPAGGLVTSTDERDCYGGGFTVRNYGTGNDGIDAIQMEFGSKLRDSDLDQLAKDAAAAIANFYETYLTLGGPLEVARLGDSGNQAGRVRDLDAVCAYSSNRVITAVETGGRRLKLISWSVGGGGSVKRVGDSGSQAGQVKELALTTAYGDPVTTVRTASKDLKVIAWELQPDEAILRRGSSGNIARIGPELAAASSGNRLVAAVQGTRNRLQLHSFEVTPGGTVTHLGDSGSQAGRVRAIAMRMYCRDCGPDISGPVSHRAITAVITRARKLKLIVWDVAADGTITRKGDSGSQAGQVREVAMPTLYGGALGETLVTTAVKAKNSRRLKLITWRVSADGETIERLADSGRQAGVANLVQQVGAGKRAPHATGTLTAVRTDAGDLKLIAWGVRPETGLVRRIGDSGRQAGAVRDIAVCSVSGDRYITSVETAAKNLKLISWKVQPRL